MRSWANSNWLDLLITVLVAVIEIATITPWIYLILISAGTDDLNPFLPIGAGVIGVGSFWVARELLNRTWDLAAMRMVSLGIWLVMILVWFGLVTGAGPLTFVDRLFGFHSGTLGLLLLGVGAWSRGLWLASTEDLFASEFIRGALMRLVISLALVLVVAAILWDEVSSALQAVTLVMVPLGFIAALITATAIQVRTARQNIQAGDDQTLPGRGWLGAGAVIAGAIMLVSAAIAGTAGREAWQLLLWPMIQVLRGLNWLLDWVILGLALIGYVILLPIFWAVQQLIDDDEEEDFVQEVADDPVFGEDELVGDSDLVPEVVLQVLQWVVIVVVVVLAIWFAMLQLKRLQQREQPAGKAEMRESMLSSEAVLNDLFGMLRSLRHGWWSRRQRFNLRREPESVRDAYQHVVVHADRQGVGRDRRESPTQYAERLKTTQPDVKDPMEDLTERYLRARYGDLTSEEDVRISREDWHMIRDRLRRQQRSDEG